MELGYLWTFNSQLGDTRYFKPIFGRGYKIKSVFAMKIKVKSVLNY